MQIFCNGELQEFIPDTPQKCEKKYLLVNIKCKYCGRMVHKNDMATHEPPCKKRNNGKTLEQRQKAAEKKEAETPEGAGRCRG